MNLWERITDGKTKGQIAKYLNETHVLTCREYMCRKGIKMHRENEKEKKLWSVTTISDMLKNEVYLGKIIWNKISDERGALYRMDG